MGTSQVINRGSSPKDGKLALVKWICRKNNYSLATPDKIDNLKDYALLPLVPEEGSS